jgi:DNA-binding NtrC family response regulator
VKLLRVLDSQMIERVGSVEPRKLEVRVMAATNRALATDVDAGRFRGDLYYRLAVVEVEVPDLADRPEDILPLARHFLAQAGGAKRIGADAEAALLAYAWPGNVRELRNAMVHATAVAPRGGERLRREDLPEAVRRGTAASRTRDGAADIAVRYAEAVTKARPKDGLLPAAVRPVEEALIRHAMDVCGGRQTDAAAMLGIHRNTLRKKLREYGIES